uniref:Heparanase n=1 Tax=Timema tahoe TaxID=61484 RepID=A0A7R9FF26_9NEOP|nr:unnamed protein product [Timema tahoe]
MPEALPTTPWDQSKKLLLLASHLSPGYLRVGGTAADCLIFNLMSDGRVEQDYTNLGQSYIRVDGGECAYEGKSCLQNRCEDFTMSVSDWDLINELAINTGLDLLFDLNVLLRDGNMWNSTNAKDLVDYSHERNYSVIWQLGNEPNAFPHAFNTSISGAQLADDFAALRSVIESHSASKEPMVVGPDVTAPRGLVTTPLTFLQEFLEAQSDSINAVTWHQYYLNGRIATLKDFIEPSIFNKLYKQILEVQQVMTKTNTSLPLWLSETSSAYGSGAPGLSDRFVAGFLWLDKLGMAARLGLKVVIRQSLYGGYYSLLDLDTLDPNPDWWVSVVYRSFVGTGVLDTPVLSNSIRVYCHCAPPHWPGAVTLFAINIDADSSAFLDVGALGLKDSSVRVFSYVLTAEGNDLRSKTVLMNGKRLKLNPDGSLPPFRPKIVSPSKLVVAPLSMAFFVFPHVDAKMCQDIDSLGDHKWETPSAQQKLPQRTRQLDVEDQLDPHFFHLSQSTGK